MRNLGRVSWDRSPGLQQRAGCHSIDLDEGHLLSRAPGVEDTPLKVFSPCGPKQGQILGEVYMLIQVHQAMVEEQVDMSDYQALQGCGFEVLKSCGVSRTIFRRLDSRR